MGGFKRTTDVTGNDNTVINGHNNTVETHHHTSTRHLSKTYLYEFCLKFGDTVQVPEKYNIDKQSNYIDKMDYNEIIYYRKKFFESDHYYSDLEEILKQIPKREAILVNINDLYDKFKSLRKWDNKDQLCEMVFEELVNITNKDENFSGMYQEDIFIALYALMYYAFTKCKLLDPVPTSRTG